MDIRLPTYYRPAHWSEPEAAVRYLKKLLAVVIIFVAACTYILTNWAVLAISVLIAAVYAPNSEGFRSQKEIERYLRNIAIATMFLGFVGLGFHLRANEVLSLIHI